MEIDRKDTFLILQGENQYGVLAALMKEFKQYLEKKFCYTVKCIDCTQEQGMQLMLEELLKEPKYVLCVEGLGFELKLEDGRYLMQVLTEEFQIPIFGWIVDSSFHHNTRLRSMGKKMKVAFVDGNETRHAREEYGITAYTIHHFGIGTDKRHTMEEREIDLFFPCSCQMFSQFEQEMLSMVLDSFDQSLIKKTAEYMLEDDTLLNWDALQRALEYFQVDVSDADVDEELKIVECWADNYYRIKRREECILKLLQIGVTLTVCGRGWKEFKEEFDVKNQIVVLSENMSYDQVLSVMGRAKMVLNICPSYKEGLHERVCTSMLQGAVCLTDSTEYMEQHFVHGKNILFYDWTNMEKTLVEAVDCLENQEKLQQIADEAYLIANGNLTVENFTKQVFEALRDV